MGRIAARAVHIALCAVAGVGYFLFVIPRWWELMGDTSHTVGTVIRIATGVFIALAALPVVLTLLRSRQPESQTPALASTLRMWSTIAHVIAGVLIIAMAVTEIWVSLDTAGPWLYGVYGAALALAILGAAGFYLSFVAEKAPAPPKQAKPKKTKKKRGKKADEAAASEDAAGTEETETETESETDDTDAQAPDDAPDDAAETDDEPEPEKSVEASESTTPDPEPASDPAPEEIEGGLRNKRPTGKTGHRLRRSARSGTAVEE